LFKSQALSDWVAWDNKAESRFVEWVGRNKVPQGVHVRQLPAILESEDAIRALSEEGIVAAQRVLSEDNPAINSKLFRRMVEMTDALRKAQLDDIQRVRRANGSKARRITQDLKKALGHFLELCGIDD
jgi:hypothetical protein